MEKYPIENPPNFRSIYSGFKQQKQREETVSSVIDSAGFGFSGGTICGFGYQLIKDCRRSVSMSLAGRLKRASVKGTRLGGAIALIELGKQIPASAMYAVCDERSKPMVMHAAYACCGFLLGAPKGFASASLTALLFSSLSLAGEGLTLWLNNSFATTCNTNTYTYPHYLPPQQTTTNSDMSHH